MKTRTAAVVAALATAACTRDVSAPPTTKTITVAPTSTYTAASTTPTTTTPSIQPGPHSALADVDLPAGTVPISSTTDTTGQEEKWRYTVSYADTVAFLRKQFATGRRYDSYGATWWRGLPPCYSDDIPVHQAPPRGWVVSGTTGPDVLTNWFWSDGARTLQVMVRNPNAFPYAEIDVWTMSGPPPVCNRA